MAIGLMSLNANSQCTAVATLSEDFNNFKKFPDYCWSGTIAQDCVDIDKPAGGDMRIALFSFYNATDPIYLITPELSSINGKNVLKFEIESGSTVGSTVQVGTLTDPTDFSSFVAAEPSFTVTGAMTHTSIPIQPVSGHKYVAIKFTPTAQYKLLYVDDVEWSASASNSTFDLNEVKVYPNPTSKIFNVESTLDIAKIEVFDASGRKVLTTTDKEINLQNASNGLYLVTVTTNDGAQGTYKLIKN